jgi:hypothetical protein
MSIGLSLGRLCFPLRGAAHNPRAKGLTTDDLDTPDALGKSLDALRFLLGNGARWTPDDRAVADTRRALYRVDGEGISAVVELLRTHHACDEKVLRDLVRTETMRSILAAVDPHRASAHRHEKRVPVRGLRPESHTPAKPTPARFPPSRYDRQRLYEEVWSEPTQQVAKRYGVSDVAIAKAWPPTT